MSSFTDWLDLIVTLFKSFKLSPLLELVSEFLPLLVLSADAGSSPEDWLFDDSLDDSTGATVHNSDICKREVEKLSNLTTDSASKKLLTKRVVKNCENLLAS